jgi:uncharacterized protein YjbI with pentapeptide repeats
MKVGDRGILIILVTVGIVMSLTSLALNPAGAFSAEWWRGLLQNFGTEMFGAAITFWLIELILNRRREQEQEIEVMNQEKERLIRDLRSSVNDISRRAVEELRHKGWLIDGTLRGIDLYEANLQKANLAGSDLQGAKMYGSNTNLQEADLHDANLRNCTLYNANLTGANLANAQIHNADLTATVLRESNLVQAKLQDSNLENANLQEANLSLADLQNAILKNARLQRANLQAVNLRGANLENADLSGVKDLSISAFDEFTVMPDGKNWTSDTMIGRFTASDLIAFIDLDTKD